jgi:S1-C subfamily serine protease
VTAESWRVAQIAVERGPGGAGSRGSGYLVGPGLVLTVAHVVAEARVVRVRLDVGQPAEVDVRRVSIRSQNDDSQVDELTTCRGQPVVVRASSLQTSRITSIVD